MSEAPKLGPSDWGHHYVDVKNMPWQPSRNPGSEQKTLYSDPAAGRTVVLFRVAPGGTIQFHEHPEVEFTYVLEGKLCDHKGECAAGNFVWREAGSRHEARTPEGATFIVVFNAQPKRL